MTDLKQSFDDAVARISVEDLTARIEAAFDADYYTSQYPDIAEAGVDPLGHFLTYGWKEGRNPRSDFSTVFYRDAHDIGGTNPLIHWVLVGQQAGLRTLDVAATEGGQDLANRSLSGSSTVEETYPDPSGIVWGDCDPEDIADIAPHFDQRNYLKRYPEVAELGVDAITHYLMLGWLKGYDPAPDFSTKYYITQYPDVRQFGMNPFVHYCRYGIHEGRETQSYMDIRRDAFRPKVSVIVPNYNHARYLPERLRSIAVQTYRNFELIILDDSSTDDSQQVIHRTVADLGIEARLEFNEVNSGNVFSQWQKGLGLATGELIWICESDDFCEPDFLDQMVSAFLDESVNIAFGRIQFADEGGTMIMGLDAYRESAESGIWGEKVTRPAAEWFDGGLGVNNLIANVGGCVFRRVDLAEQVWAEAQNYRICGDWFLYLHIAGPGQITFNPEAVAYFRQHGANTSASNFDQRYYYEENARILRLVAETWGISHETRLRFIDKVRWQYDHFGVAKTCGDFDTVFGVEELLAVSRKSFHVQLLFLGFYPGGGELFPINLANALVKAGCTVSMIALDLLEINTDMRQRLDSRIPVYHASHLAERGRKAFFEAAMVDVLNSHIASADVFLHMLGRSPMEVPLVVTLHGSYVGLEGAPEPMIGWILQNVSRWIYTADRNLEFFETRPVDPGDFIKLPNAMPRDDRPAPFTRDDLGIRDTDVVFAFVARGIKRKGWRASVEALRAVRQVTGRGDVHLLLVGDGEEAEKAKALAGDLPGLHFLGYQSEVNGILRLSDCLILPSRFEGESYPLCLIQALQEHLPVVATEIGETRSMMTSDLGAVAGVLLENQRDTRDFTRSLTSAMIGMLDARTRAEFRAMSEVKAKEYDLDKLAAKYLSVFTECAGG